ncbi:MAG: polyprenyl synthetase family protein [Pseudomonadota bacterium]|nr:polyprenyl synthetase family protein [Pseudomonadota bacterium]
MPVPRPSGAEAPGPDRRPWSAGSARRSLLLEVERLAAEMRGPLGGLEEAIIGLVDGEGLPPGLSPEILFEGGMPRMRPVLVVLAGRAATERDATERDADPQAAFEVAAIAEMLQGAIRLHDMALGRRDGRRRRAARRVLRGAGSLLGANHLTLRALELARRAPAPEILGETLELLRDVGAGHALGEALRTRPATVADALLFAEEHSGALFAFTCRAGGHLVRAGRPAITGLGRYGRHVGIACKLAEDLALFDPAAGGRQLAQHAAASRPVFPVAFANAKDPAIDPLWRRLGVGGYDDAVAIELGERVRALGGLGAGREAMIRETWAARRALRPLPPSPARDSLDRLAASLATVAA